MATEENAIAAAVCEWLDWHGIPHHRLHCGKVRVKGGWLDLGEAGWPDIVASVPPCGWSWYIETKTVKAAVTAEQRLVHARLRVAGAVVTVARGIEDLERDYARACVDEKGRSHERHRRISGSIRRW